MRLGRSIEITRSGAAVCCLVRDVSDLRPRRALPAPPAGEELRERAALVPMPSCRLTSRWALCEIFRVMMMMMMMMVVATFEIASRDGHSTCNLIECIGFKWTGSLSLNRFTLFDLESGEREMDDARSLQISATTPARRDCRDRVTSARSPVYQYVRQHCSKCIHLTDAIALQP